MFSRSVPRQRKARAGRNCNRYPSPEPEPEPEVTSGEIEKKLESHFRVVPAFFVGKLKEAPK